MRPKHNRFPTVIASLVAAALAGCSTPPGLTLQPGTAMLVAIGSPSPDSGDGTVAGSGAYRLRENPTRFDILGWRGLSASHITTTEDGRWIYIATDDGVLVSRDGGASFWMTGATVLRSVRRVAAVPDYPHQVFAATSTGVFFTHDITADTDAWRPFKPTTHVQRCNDIQVDIHDTQTVWVASDSGVFLAEPQDPRFRRMTAPTQVHRILQDRTNRDHVWATTDKRGVIKSADGGKTWIQVTGTSGPCYSIAHYPAAPATIIVTGKGKVWTLRADGASWATAQLASSEQSTIYDIAFDPRNPGVAFVATSDGIFGTRNGSPWMRIALPNTKIMAIRYTTQHDQQALPFRSKARPKISVSTGPGQVREVSDPQYSARQRNTGRALARSPMPAPTSDDFFFAALGRLREDRGSPEYWAAVRAALAHPAGTQRGELARRAFFLHCERLLPADLRAEMRHETPLRGLVRGCGEHCWMMHYATVLLTAVMIPDPRNARWFNGLSTQENVRTATNGLLHWATTLGHKGQMDCDSPCDLSDTIASLLLLHDFVEDPGLQKIATDTLDLILAERLSESLRGFWCGTHNRHSTQDLMSGGAHELASLHYLFAGGISQPTALPAALSVAAYSFFQPLPLLNTIANDRQRPYVVQKTKRSLDNRPQHSRGPGACRKYTFMTQTYAMASLDRAAGGATGNLPWNLIWRSKGDRSVIFPTLTPPSKKTSGAVASPQRPSLSTQQSRNTLLLLYDLPSPRSASISLPASLRLEEAGGWLFGFDGEFHVAIHATRKARIKQDPHHPGRKLYRSHGRHLGFAVIAGSSKVPAPGQSRPETRQQFKRRILATAPPRMAADPATRTLAYTFADNSRLRVTTDQAEVAAEQKLFDSPFLSASINSGSIQVSNGTRGHQIEFGSLR